MNENNLEGMISNVSSEEQEHFHTITLDLNHEIRSPMSGILMGLQPYIGTPHEKNAEIGMAIGMRILDEADEILKSDEIKKRSVKLEDVSSIFAPYHRAINQLEGIIDELPKNHEMGSFIHESLQANLARAKCLISVRHKAEPENYTPLTLIDEIKSYSSEQFPDIKINTSSVDNLQAYHKVPQVETIISNLVRNACQMMKNQDGATVSIEASYAGDNVPHYIKYSITDNGPGVPEHIRGNIFEDKISAREGGTGRGLFMVQQEVNAQGGYVTMTTETGKGTQFNVYLPVQESITQKIDYKPSKSLQLA